MLNMGEKEYNAQVCVMNVHFLVSLEQDTLRQLYFGFFFDDMKHALRNILPSVAVTERTARPKFDSLRPRTKDLFRLYDHVDKTGISVLERRSYRDYAEKRLSIRWTKQDVAGEFRDRIQDRGSAD